MAEIRSTRSREVIAFDNTISSISELVRQCVSNKISLRGADLRSANLSGMDLTNLDLSESLLCDARFDRCDLRGVDFSNANFSNATFHGARINGETCLNGVQFIGGELTGVLLR